ncbi:centrosomal protein of 63 kDa-like isoform X1 [Hylaeus volcanicus]|uniref:centrosomal protein of 63 kDa-like isoform X1 n=1 Tax=Hylaeus volcanicus TaxID=313075 RepID=UPI0023B87C0D|nr:centrosomal protein of 63 kDa-like isoform X1 [Hylaeus volcanicus]
MDQKYISSMYKWFEECGVISNIRTHLRQNLVNALKNKDLVLKSDGPKSAKQYVYDLLIAEYLFNHNYAYTLSVFASEAPLLVNFSNKTMEKSDRNENDNEKLRSDYVLHALETLGINPHDTKGKHVISQYIKNDMPLLLCILKCITMFFYNTHNSVPIKENVSLCNESTQTQFSWRAYKLQIEKLEMLKKKVSMHKQVVDSKLRKREMMLKEKAVLIERQLEVLNTKLEQVQKVVHSVSLKEQQLKETKMNNEQYILQKEMKLALKERLLLQEENRLQKEQTNCKKLEDVEKLQEQETRKTSTSRDLKNMEVQTEFVSNPSQEERIKALTKEKEELTALIKDQQLKIEQITQRALQLCRQIEGIRTLRPTSVEIPTQTANTNTVISESSSTEDILHDAKLRLKRLEEESLKADQYYYNFINNS